MHPVADSTGWNGISEIDVSAGTVDLLYDGEPLDLVAEPDFTEVADVSAAALRPEVGDDEIDRLRARVTRLADRHPLYPDLGEAR